MYAKIEEVRPIFHDIIKNVLRQAIKAKIALAAIHQSTGFNLNLVGVFLGKSVSTEISNLVENTENVLDTFERLMYERIQEFHLDSDLVAQLINLKVLYSHNDPLQGIHEVYAALPYFKDQTLFNKVLIYGFLAQCLTIKRTFENNGFYQLLKDFQGIPNIISIGSGGCPELHAITTCRQDARITGIDHDDLYTKETILKVYQNLFSTLPENEINIYTEDATKLLEIPALKDEKFDFILLLNPLTHPFEPSTDFSDIIKKIIPRIAAKNAVIYVTSFFKDSLLNALKDFGVDTAQLQWSDQTILQSELMQESGPLFHYGPYNNPLDLQEVLPHQEEPIEEIKIVRRSSQSRYSGEFFDVKPQPKTEGVSSTCCTLL